MESYKGILFQRGDESVRNSSEWGCYVMKSPYIPCASTPKNITSQKWFDENGDDEYIPSVLYYEPIEATIEFVFKGTIAQAKTQIIAFISYLQGGEFKFYDEFYQKGYGRVRVLKLSDAEFVYDCGDTDKGVATFSVVLKINDPVTDIVLRYEGI